MTKIYLDSAREEITELITIFDLEGATSNPTILMRDNTLISEFVSRVPKGKQFFIQLVSMTADAMVEEAEELSRKYNGVIVKIPATKEGYIAMKAVTRRGIPVLGTAIYSFQQAVLSIQCGASYVAPYVNRISKIGKDGLGETASIQQYIRNSQSDCKVVAASFKNVDQINQIFAIGIDSITIPYTLFNEFLESKYADEAVKQFKKDWIQLLENRGNIEKDNTD